MRSQKAHTAGAAFYAFKFFGLYDFKFFGLVALT
jgi:hypothetical protein